MVKKKAATILNFFSRLPYDITEYYLVNKHFGTIVRESVSAKEKTILINGIFVIIFA